jgi:hypothetical protein
MLGVDPNRPARAFRGTDPAALRAMLGAEAFERMQRMRELHRHPRPLTGQEREVVRRAAAALLRDLAACAWIQRPGRTGTGIWVSLSAAPAEQVAKLRGDGGRGRCRACRTSARSRARSGSTGPIPARPSRILEIAACRGSTA